MAMLLWFLARLGAGQAGEVRDHGERVERENRNSGTSDIYLWVGRSIGGIVIFM